MPIEDSVESSEAMLDRSGRRILAGSGLALGLLMMYFVTANPFGKGGDILSLAVITTLVALAPLCFWLNHPSRNPIPVLGLHGLFYALCFGFAGFVTPDRYTGSIQANDQEYVRALETTALSLLCCYGGYALGVRTINLRLPRWMDRDDSRIHTAAVAILFPTMLLIRLAVERYGIPNVSQTVDTFQVATFLWVLHAAWSGRLNTRARQVVLWLYLPIQLIVSSGIGSGALAPLMVTAQLVGITFIAVRRRIPLTPIAAAATVFVLLQPVKLQYRDFAWRGPTEVSEAAGTLEFFRLGYENVASEDPWRSMLENVETSYTRINHLHLTAAIIADTPVLQPYRWGETYAPLFTKWIPRAIWLEKPREDLGNRWAQDYGYLFYTDDVTSFNLPWLAEMYMNFGVAGVATISGFVGLLMALVWSVFAGGSDKPIGFSSGLVLCSSFFFPESNLSLQVGNLAIALMSLLTAFWLLGVFAPQRATEPIGR